MRLPGGDHYPKELGGRFIINLPVRRTGESIHESWEILSQQTGPEFPDLSKMVKW